MKNLKLVLAVVLASFGFSAQAAEIGGSVGVGTDYIFRGVSQMDDFAISGDVHVEHKGISAGVWASQVDYGTEIDIEYDYWAQVEFGGENFTVTGGYIDYNYASMDEFESESPLDVEEVFGKVQVKNVAVSYFLGLDDAPDYWQADVSVFGHFDFSYGDYETVGTHWRVSKGYKIFEGTPIESDLEVGYVDFTAEDDSGMADEKQAYFGIIKHF